LYDCPAAIDSLQIFWQKLQQVRQFSHNMPSYLGTLVRSLKMLARKMFFI
jgi:hypothetical protein